MTPPGERYRLPISVKAALVDRGRVCLLLNERNQWELPGGGLEAGESPEACLSREVREETGLEISVEGLLDARFFRPVPDKEIFIVVYRCSRLSPGDPVISSEHRDSGWYTLAELSGLVLPEGYLRSLERALNPPT
ncbi:MAG TPA: NUDIX domain-containing protein [Candidatus Dormibacteraeota bacterium]|nr:NUDIX domain-containing protein [Candidatus Dormibacteraeota bacterium]